MAVKTCLRKTARFHPVPLKGKGILALVDNSLLKTGRLLAFLVALLFPMGQAMAMTPEEAYQDLTGRIQMALIMHSDPSRLPLHVTPQIAFEAVSEVLGEIEGHIAVETMAALRTRNPGWSNYRALFFAIGLKNDPDRSNYKDFHPSSPKAEKE